MARLSEGSVLIAHLLLLAIKMAGNFLVLLNKILFSMKNLGCG